MYTSAISAALLAIAGSTAALPTASTAAAESFALLSVRSGDVNLHLRPITASEGQFFIGKPTQSYCPSDSVGASSCPAGNTTSLSAVPGGDTASMNVVVPGGQQVFVAKSGYLGYTPAHSVGQPDQQIATGFTYEPASDGSVGSFSWGEQGFTACPTGDEGVYQIKAYIDGLSYIGCTGVGVATNTVQGAGAWQYA